MERLEVSGAVRPLYGSLGIKGLSPVSPNHNKVFCKRFMFLWMLTPLRSRR